MLTTSFRGLCLLYLAALTPSQNPRSVEDQLRYRLYLASLAAADGALKLHDTPAARRWLDEAPQGLRGWEWSLLRARSDRSTSVIDAGEGVTAVATHGEHVATAGARGAVRLWDPAGAPVRAFGGHDARVNDVAFSPDGTRLASISSDGSARVWDVADGEELLRLDGVGSGVGGLGWHPTGERLVTCSWDRSSERGVWGTVQEWDAGTGERLRSIDYGDKPLVAAAYSPDGGTLAIGSWDSEVALWDTRKWGTPVQLYPPASEAYQAVDGIAFTGDGSRLAVAARDGVVRVWDLGSRQIVRTLTGQAEGQPQPIWDIAFVGDGVLATAGGDRTLRLWDVATGVQTALFHGHVAPLRAVAARGRRIYTGGDDGTLRVWDLDQLAPARDRWQSADVMYGVAFSADGSEVAVSGWTGWVEVFDFATGEKRRAWRGHENSAVHCDWSSDDRWIATTGNDGRVVLWDAADGSEVATLVDAGSTQITAVAFSPDASQIAVEARPAGRVIVFSVPDGEPVRQLEVGAPTWSVGYSPDGRRLAVGNEDGSVSLFDAATGELERRLSGGGGRTSFAFAADGDRIATAAGDGVIRMWRAASGESLGSWPGHDSGVYALAFHPDGTRLASGSGDRTARVWDVATGAQVLIEPFEAGVWNLSWSRDGRALVALPLRPRVIVLRADERVR